MRRINMILVMMAALSVGLGVWTSASAQSLTWLGVPGGNASIALRVSEDGAVVVGRAGVLLTDSNSANAYLWNLRTGEVIRLSDNGGAPWGITPDGSKVVGATNTYASSNSSRAFIWSQATGRVILPGGGTHWALCITPDGSRAGGAVHPYPALWDTASNPPQLLRVYNNRGYRGEIHDLSDDGQTALCFTVSSTYRARIWQMNNLDITQEFVLEPFSGDPYTLCMRLSADGAVAVGMSGQIRDIWYGVGSNYRPAMWRAGNNWQVEPLATLGGQRGFAFDVDAGSIVGFCSTPAGENRAVRWRVGTATTAVEDLNVTYASLLSSGSVLRSAYGISRNGRYIVGWGYNAATGREEAFLLDTQPSTFHIRGNVQLRDYSGDITQVPITVELYQNGAPVRAQQIYLDANENYTVGNVAAGTYDVAFKASHWLRVVVRGVAVTDADVDGVNASLTNGDIDGDNEVTLFDFGALVAAFGSVPGDSNWNPDADLDGDAEVTLFDFGILVRNFGAVGDEP